MIRLLLAAALALSACLAAHAGGFDAKLFDVWAAARTGIGSGGPVYWYSTGTVRAFPSGELLFLMEGFDAANAARPDPDRPYVEQYNRKIYVFRDAKTGAILESWNGKPVEPVAYPYQFITYELKGDQVETFVEQGKGARVQRIGPGTSMTARWVGDTAVYTAPVYLDLPLPGGARLTAFENYDFFIQPEKAKLKEPHQLSWVRTGDLPAWAGGGPAVMHLVTWRVERFEDIPGDLKDHIRAKHPLWQAPPKDLAEIRALQKETTP